MHVCVCFCALWQTLERNSCLDQILFLWSQIDYGMNGVGVRVTWNGMRVALVSQCVAGCCKVLQQGVAGCCRVLQGVAGCCCVLQCVAMIWNGMHVAFVSQSVTGCCRVLQGLEITWNYLRIISSADKSICFTCFTYLFESVALCCVVLCCVALQCVTLCCSVLQRVAVYLF